METFKVFSKNDFYNIAKIIDNNFIGSEETFTTERKKGYYYLTTNKCDDCSFVKIFSQIGNINIDKIERLGSDTDGFEEIYPKTYDNVKKYIKSIIT